MVYRWRCGCISKPVPIKRDAKRVIWIETCDLHPARQGTEALLKWHPKEYGAVPIPAKGRI